MCIKYTDNQSINVSVLDQLHLLIAHLLRQCWMSSQQDFHLVNMGLFSSTDRSLEILEENLWDISNWERLNFSKKHSKK